MILSLLLSYLGDVYFADAGNHRVRKVTMSTGIITAIAGSSTSGSYSGDNGPATSATLFSPTGIALDSTGIFLLSIFTLLHFLTHLGNLYIADYNNHRIRKVTVSTGIITNLAGTGTSSYSGDNGPATAATLYNPNGVALDSAGTHSLYYSIFLLIFYISFLFT